MNQFFIADPHLGHQGIERFRGITTTKNTEWILDAWRSKVKKRDRVWVLGDAAFDEDHLLLFKDLPGKSKILVKGNHDDLTPTAAQARVFDEIHGMVKFKEFWLTHCPMHQQELRGRPNIHGHVHSFSVPDPRYLNACAERLEQNFGSPLISLSQVREHFRSQGWRTYRCSVCDRKFSAFPKLEKVECPAAQWSPFCAGSIPAEVHCPGS